MQSALRTSQSNLLNSARPGPNVRMSKPPIRVLIAHDQPIYRQGVRGVFSSDPTFEVVGEASNGRDVVDLARRQRPDVVLIDARLDRAAGVEATRSIRRELPGIAVGIIAESENEEELFHALNAGAGALFRQDIRPEELIAGVRRLSHGESLINQFVPARPLVASHVIHQFRDHVSSEQSGEPFVVPLSAREIEVLTYIARGNSNKEIARVLNISDQTVKNHITSILKKLAVNDRTQAVVHALRHGWIELAEA